MDLSEFRKAEKNTDSINKKWFELFEIKCKKCGSVNVELFGDIDYEEGYYDNIEQNGKVIIKCHKCGNAKIFNLGDYGFKKWETGLGKLG